MIAWVTTTERSQLHERLWRSLVASDGISRVVLAKRRISFREFQLQSTDLCRFSEEVRTSYRVVGVVDQLVHQSEVTWVLGCGIGWNRCVSCTVRHSSITECGH